MKGEIVVDTNVFMHASNTQEAMYLSSRDFVQQLIDWNELELCVDDGFNLEESKNRSAIVSEYFARISQDMLAWQVILHLGRVSRIRTVSKAVSSQTNRKISQRVRDKSDRVFVKVALNTVAKRLLSHDFSDIPTAFRVDASTWWGLQIKTSDDIPF